MTRSSRLFLLAALALILSACASQQPGGPAVGQGRYKVGTPYQINGQWYTPKEDFSYDETGIASWYGEDFNHGATANGEVFNKNELTAAHKTLPLPTLARVTNLENGRSIVVRINDRGPFASGRIIDVSQRAAQLLGFEQKGTAMVRVQVLADESKAIADAMRHYGTAPPTEIASAEAPPPAMQRRTAVAASAIETKTLEPIRTTPAVHRQLLETRPVPEVVQMPVTGNNRIYVQAGAFTVLANADRLKQTLASLGRVSISDISINGKLFHRVRVGPVANVRQADALLAKVRRSGSMGARTVVD